MCGNHCFVNYTFCLTKFHVVVAVVFRKIPSDPSDAVVGASGNGNRNIILQVKKFISFSFLLHVFTLHAIMYTANTTATKRSLPAQSTWREISWRHLKSILRDMQRPEDNILTDTRQMVSTWTRVHAGLIFFQVFSSFKNCMWWNEPLIREKSSAPHPLLWNPEWWVQCS